MASDALRVESEALAEIDDRRVSLHGHAPQRAPPWGSSTRSPRLSSWEVGPFRSASSVSRSGESLAGMGRITLFSCDRAGLVHRWRKTAGPCAPRDVAGWRRRALLRGRRVGLPRRLRRRWRLPAGAALLMLRLRRCSGAMVTLGVLPCRGGERRTVFRASSGEGGLQRLARGEADRHRR